MKSLDQNDIEQKRAIRIIRKAFEDEMDLSKKEYDYLFNHIAKAKYIKTRLAGAGYVMDDTYVGEGAARAMLHALGIKQPKKG